MLPGIRPSCFHSCCRRHKSCYNRCTSGLATDPRIWQAKNEDNRDPLITNKKAVLSQGTTARWGGTCMSKLAPNTRQRSQQKQQNDGEVVEKPTYRCISEGQMHVAALYHGIGRTRVAALCTAVTLALDCFVSEISLVLYRKCHFCT